MQSQDCRVKSCSQSPDEGLQALGIVKSNKGRRSI